jgi:hypothetical protein
MMKKILEYIEELLREKDYSREPWLTELDKKELTELLKEFKGEK